jgi:hypothetical protein
MDSLDRLQPALTESAKHGSAVETPLPGARIFTIDCAFGTAGGRQ